MLSNAGFDVSTATVDVSSRESVHALVETATALGDVTGVIHAAGVSPSAGVAGDDPRRRPLRNRAGARGVRERHRPRRRRRRHRVAVRAPPGRADRRAGRGSRDDARRRAAGAAHASARPGEGLPPRLPARQARERAAGDGRGGEVGQARRAGQHDQPRHHHHAARQGRADRAPRRRLPAHDRAVPGRARRHPRRGRHVGALLMGPDGAFITGSDFLMDGGVTASYWFGELAPR